LKEALTLNLFPSYFLQHNPADYPKGWLLRNLADKKLKQKSARSEDALIRSQNQRGCARAAECWDLQV
jgi:hypothetical protein